jgi:hypothetical protein
MGFLRLIRYRRALAEYFFISFLFSLLCQHEKSRASKRGPADGITDWIRVLPQALP